MPTPTATASLVPTRPASLSLNPDTLVLKTDPDVLLGPDTPTKHAAITQIRADIRQHFGRYEVAGGRAGIVLTFGTAPSSSTGGRLSKAVNTLLKEEIPSVFVDGNTVFRDFHYISSDRAQHGNINVEVYLLLGGP
jgi:hypothetical protein